jgi:mannose-6-phosphate isomerase-like protein (cupin superfamily)
MSSRQTEAFTFQYDRPEFPKGRKVKMLARTDRMHAIVSSVKEGGENNLHSHRHQDGFYYVLKGRVTFYTTDDKVIGDLGPNEGIVIPRGYPYWFESSGEEMLELLSVESYDAETIGEPMKDRVDHQPQKTNMTWLKEDTAS